MLSSQADEYTVTPARVVDSQGMVRSGLRGFVRDIKMRSLRRKKTCSGIINFSEETVQHDQSVLQGHRTPDTSSPCIFETPKHKRLHKKEFDNLHLGSYKKLKSPIFYAGLGHGASPRINDKENIQPETPTVSQKKKRRSLETIQRRQS